MIPPLLLLLLLLLLFVHFSSLLSPSSLSISCIFSFAFPEIIILLILSSSSSISNTGGKVAVFGDSNCLDSAHLQSGRYWYTSSTHFHLPTLTSPLDCFWLLDALLKYAVEGVVPQYVTASTRPLPPAFLPKRMEGQLTLFINHNERSIFVLTARHSS